MTDAREFGLFFIAGFMVLSIATTGLWALLCHGYRQRNPRCSVCDGAGRCRR